MTHRFVSSHLVLSLLTAACLVLFGSCDSGGSNGPNDDIPSGKSPVEVTNNLEGDITAEVSNSDLSSATLVVQELESEDGNTAYQKQTQTSLDLSDGSASASLQNPDNFVGPNESAGSEDDPDGFELYALRVVAPTETDLGADLTLTLLVDGTAIAEATEPRAPCAVVSYGRALLLTHAVWSSFSDSSSRSVHQSDST